MVWVEAPEISGGVLGIHIYSPLTILGEVGNLAPQFEYRRL